jgi:hypothetical protein
MGVGASWTAIEILSPKWSNRETVNLVGHKKMMSASILTRFLAFPMFYMTGMIYTVYGLGWR